MADYEGRYLHQQFGNYRLVKLLGYGGFAEVYLGEHIHMGTQAAVKVLTAKLTSDEIEHFRNEARTIFGLEHPNIVRVLDYGLNGNIPYIVMSYAANGSLRKRHPRGTRVPLPTVVEYVKQIASALQYAHDHNIIHRDIKPDNVLVGSRGELLIGDFGIAVISKTGRSSLQSSYNIGGTPYYMAPEAFRGKPEKASDQYALGIMVYEWLCGNPPYTEGDSIQIGYQHNYEPIPSLREQIPSISSVIEQVVMQVLEKSPKERYARVQEIADKLEGANNKPPIGTTLMVYRGHTDRVTSIAWSPDGQCIVSSSKYGAIQVWNTISGKEIFRYRYLPGSEGTVAWSPNGRYIAVGTCHHAYSLSLSKELPANPSGIKILDSSNSNLVHTYGRTIADAVNAIAWSSNGKYIASSNENDPSIHIWDVTIDTTAPNSSYSAATNASARFRTHSCALAWSPNDRYIASCYENTVHVQEIATNHCLLTYEGHTSLVRDLAWSPDGQRIASCSDDGTVQVWKATTGKLLFTYQHNWNIILDVAWSPDGQQIASCIHNGTIRIWDATTGELLFTYQSQTDHSQGSAGCVAWSPDGQRIASSSEDGALHIWQAV